MARRVLIFHNAHAAKGRSRKGLERILDIVNREKFEYKIQTTLTGFEANRRALVMHYERFKPSEIWVSGGDGTLHLFLNSLPAEMWDLPVAVIPTGSGNDFIKNYSKDTSIEHCLQVAVARQTMPCDVWQCNGRLFIHGFGVGFDGQVVESMAGESSPVSGFMQYYFHILRLLMTYREKEFTVTAGDTVYKQPCFLVTVGNSTTFGGGFNVTPNAKLNDNQLDVCMISKVKRMMRPFWMRKVEKGTHLKLSVVTYFNTDKIKIETPVKIPAHIDGELLHGNLFEIESHSRKLNIIVLGI